jgi:drug/metabolite transporter (DMT)-like permease
LVGFVGLAILVLPGDRPEDAPLWGLLLLIAAAVFWASGSFYAKKLPLPDDLLVWTAWEMLIGGAAMIAVGLVAGEASGLDVGTFSADSWIALAYLIVVGSLVAFSAYAWLLRHVPISTVATYAYVNPVIAIFLGWAILSEEITATMIAGALAIVMSVAAVVRREGEVEMATEPAGRPSRFPRRTGGSAPARAAGSAVPTRTPTPRA